MLSLIASDAQERLVFCAVRTIRDDVQGFAPTSADLDYPGALDDTRETNSPCAYF